MNLLSQKRGIMAQAIIKPLRMSQYGSLREKKFSQTYAQNRSFLTLYREV